MPPAAGRDRSDERCLECQAAIPRDAVDEARTERVAVPFALLLDWLCGACAETPLRGEDGVLLPEPLPVT